MRKDQIDELHKQARLAVESAAKAAEPDLKQAAEYLAKAVAIGSSQRQSAKAIGKSAAWVNALLRWRDGGYKPHSPFHPELKCSSDEQSKSNKSEKSASSKTQAKKEETAAAAAQEPEPDPATVTESAGEDDVAPAAQAEAETAAAEPHPNKEKAAAILSVHNSARNLHEFEYACNHYLPKLNTADLEKASEHFQRVYERLKEKKAA
jgi:hypothetical protein